MPARSFKLSLVALGALVSGMLAAAPVAANDIAQIKTLTGTVIIERGAERLLGAVGTRMQQADVVRTGIDGSVGITFTDNTLISAGPNSIVVLDRYAFDSTTHEGRLDTSVRAGTLSVVSGKIAKQSPDAMTVKTPSTILGVRGTEFFVQVDEPR